MIRRLHTNLPNPFSEKTMIPFELSEESEVRLSLHLPDGEEVALITEARFGFLELAGQPIDVRGLLLKLRYQAAVTRHELGHVCAYGRGRALQGKRIHSISFSRQIRRPATGITTHEMPAVTCSMYGIVHANWCRVYASGIPAKPARMPV